MAAVASRERVLSDTELRAIWGATKSGGFNAIVRMLDFDGQRRDEVAGMTWYEMIRRLRSGPFRRTGRRMGRHIVPLSPPAQAIIKSAPRYAGDGVCLPRRAGAFSGCTKAKAGLDRDSGVKDWRFHDLRRTMATGLQRLGARLEVTEAVLNHVSGSRGGVVGVYQAHDGRTRSAPR